jgi:hypothetical protein
MTPLHSPVDRMVVGEITGYPSTPRPEDLLRSARRRLGLAGWLLVPVRAVAWLLSFGLMLPASGLLWLVPTRDTPDTATGLYLDWVAFGGYVLVATVAANARRARWARSTVLGAARFGLVETAVYLASLATVGILDIHLGSAVAIAVLAVLAANLPSLLLFRSAAVRARRIPAA